MPIQLDFNYVNQIRSNRIIIANAQITLAHKFKEERKWVEARELYQDAIGTMPNDPILWVYLGECWNVLSRRDRAFSCFKVALSLNPNLAMALMALAECHTAEQEPDEALHFLNKAESLCDDTEITQSSLWASKGNAYYAKNDFAEAEKCFLKASEKRPNYYAPYGNLGNIYFGRNEFEKARASYLKAFELSKDPQMALNLGILAFSQGKYKEGWEWYGQRLTDTRHVEFSRFQGRKLWSGEKVDTLFISTEQGLGDFVQFARYFRLAKQLCKKLIVETQPNWVHLALEFEGPDEIVPWVNENTVPRDFDAWCSLMNLPVALNLLTPEESPETPYLELSTVEPKKRPQVAVFWQGNKEHANDKQRSILLESFKPLIESRPDISWVTYHPEKQALEDINHTGLPIEQITGSVLESARRLAECDLVITVDTGPAHISAAQNVPTWILLPPNPDWRWGLKEEKTPWYKSVKLYRAKERRSWDDVFSKLIEDIGCLT